MKTIDRKKLDKLVGEWITEIIDLEDQIKNKLYFEDCSAKQVIIDITRKKINDLREVMDGQE